MTEKQKKYVPNKKLREYRIAHNWTQETFAARIGVAVQTLRRWESGQHAPPTPMRERLCEELRTTPQQLGFEPEEEIFTPSKDMDSFSVADQVAVSSVEEKTPALEEDALATELQKSDMLVAHEVQHKSIPISLSERSSLQQPISFLKAHMPSFLLIGLLSFSLLGGAFFTLRTTSSQASFSPPHTICFSDEFHSGESLDGWQWIDEDRDSDRNIDQHGFYITAPQANKNLWKYNNNAPRLLQSVIGDFIVETQVEFMPHIQYQGAGLLIYGDSKHFIRLEHAFSQFGGVEFERYDAKANGDLRFTSISSTAYIKDKKARSMKVSASSIQLQLQRAGDVFTASWRPAGSNQAWRVVGKTMLHLNSTIQVGLLLISDSKEQPDLQAVSHYSYFHISCSHTT